MSEGDVSLIHDEDLLRRMWQQTEDFARKKEIRAHMYRLRETRLRTLHAMPHHHVKGEVGREGHMQSFADDSFQRLKHKEVRDAASPTRSLAPDGAADADLGYEPAGGTLLSRHVEYPAGGRRVIETRRLPDGSTVTNTRCDIVDHQRARDHADFHHQRTHVELSTAELSTTNQQTRIEKSSTVLRETSEQRETLDSRKCNEVVSSEKSFGTEYNIIEKRKEKNDDHQTPRHIDEEHRHEKTRVEISSTASSDFSDHRETLNSWKCNEMLNSQKNIEKLGNCHSTDRIVDHCIDGNLEKEGQRERSVQVEKSSKTSRETTDRNETRKFDDTVSSQKLTTEYDFRENNQSTESKEDRHCIGTNVDQVDRCESASVPTQDVQIDVKNNQLVDDHKLPEVQEAFIEKKVSDEYRKGVNDKKRKVEAKEEVIEKKEAYSTSDQYHTTYQTDYPQRSRISQELSPSHQAWASSLRGDSPPRAARTSPARSSLDRHSSTHSTYSITDSRSDVMTDRHIPDRRSPRSRNTPDRFAASPEKVSQNGMSRFSTSPERKPKTVPSKSSVSPERPRVTKEKNPRESPQRKNPTFDRRSVSPTKTCEPAAKASLSPERKPSRPASILIDSLEGPLPPTRSSVSPDRKPSYMKPTAASSPNKPHDKSPEKNIFDTNTKMTTGIKKDHYRLVDEETKIYNRFSQDDSTNNVLTRTSTIKKSKSPSPTRTTLGFRTDSPATNKSSLRQESRSPSPPKGPVSFTSDTIDETSNTHMETNKTFTGQYVDSTSQFNQHVDTSITKKFTQQTPPLPSDENVRESSPTKYGTYEKKHRKDVEDLIRAASTEIRYSNSTRCEQNISTCNADKDLIVTKSPRTSVSPTKSAKEPSKDNYRYTTDFISTERQTEEINKINTAKGRPRQLVTPSTSPTRRPKVDTAPSTGQSSPTTSVSGFIYYGSPQTDIVTDLDHDHYYENIKSDTIKRSQSPTKIPCRSPSPQKRISPIKENLPRKSSLKKPSVDSAITSAVEKPPTTFIVSPTEERQNIPQHKIVKKDRAESPVADSPKKLKPPFERRETYEERCKKILGMIDDTVIETSKIFQTSDSNTSHRSSLGPKESSSIERKSTDMSSLQKEIAITSTNKIKGITSKSKTPSRESSPTKLKDVMHLTNYLTSVVNDEIVIDSSNNSKKSRSKQLQSPEPQPHTELSSVKSHKLKESSKSPERKPAQQRASLSPVKQDKTKTINSTAIISNTNNETVTESKYSSARSSISPDCKTPKELNDKSRISLKQTGKSRTPSPTKKVIEPTKSELNQTVSTVREKKNSSRTPSPAKNGKNVEEQFLLSRESSPLLEKKISLTENFLVSEREQQVLEKVQKSLRKLSPGREANVTASRDKSPCRTFVSLQKLDEIEVCLKENEDIKTTFDNMTTTKNDIHNTYKKIEASSTASKLPSRNVSPTKKPSPLSSPKTEKKPETPTKPRSGSPKKPCYHSPSERPQSPQLSKVSGPKAKEPSSSLTHSATTRSTFTTKGDKTTVIELKKTAPKQNSATSFSKSITKSTVNSKTETDIEKTTRGINKENVSPKKEPVTRATSDFSVRSKKPLPQRMKSKPEIQVSDTSKSQTSGEYRKRLKEPQPKLASKPKSATTLNTSIDEDDIIIDVQQAKSSRENSPDRICPTPIGFMEDVGTPRYPDEVREPDEEFQRRTHHAINETESIVDDIIEISEDDELFVKRTDTHVEHTDDSLLSVTGKVSKCTNKMNSIEKQKDTIVQFKDSANREHSGLVEDQLKSDECLLSVTEKVNKFAKGPIDKTDSQNKTRNVVDEYDINTLYQDDYTKLSVNDKAHLFVETAEKAKVTKVKSPHKVERPDLTSVDESLKSDNCLLSVSDKVNKFVKSAEDFLDQTRINEEKERKIQEQHELIMKRIADSVEETKEITQKKVPQDPQTERKSPDDIRDSFAKETTSSLAKSKESRSRNIKTSEGPASFKITAQRSSEAVKKAKALFENIATTQKDTSKITKLTDIGVIRTPRKEVTNGQKSEKEERPLSPLVKSESTTPLRRRSSPARPLHEAPRPKSPPKSTHPLAFSPAGRPAANSPPHDSSPSHPASHDTSPGYLRATATSQLKEERPPEEVDARRVSGKFGVELRPAQRPSAPTPVPAAATSDRRRSEPCIEDIHDIALLEQMLEQVVGYEQRRRIRAQLRVARRDRPGPVRPAPREPSPRKFTSSTAPSNSLVNGHAKEPTPIVTSKKLRTRSPEKAVPKKIASPSRQTSPEKKTITRLPNDVSSSAKPKSSRFSEYATAYMKKVGLSEANATATSNLNGSKIEVIRSTGVQEVQTVTEHRAVETRVSSSSIVRSEEATAPTRTPSPRRHAAGEETPAWQKERSLRRVVPDSRPASARPLVPAVPRTRIAPSPAPTSPAEAVISSYGPGPLDEQGRPIFGIKALRNGSNYRVRGTVVRSECSSRDGGAPTGSVTLAAYTNEPVAHATNGTSPRLLQGLAAISTTRKFGGSTGLSISDVYTKEDRASLDQFTQSNSRHSVIDDVTGNRRQDDTTARQNYVTTDTSCGLDITEMVEKRAPSLDKEKRSHSFDKKERAEKAKTQSEVIEKRAGKTQEKRESSERKTKSSERKMESVREDRKTIRQSSVKSLTEKYIKSASETTKSDRSTYPKAGLILRASVSSSVPSDASYVGKDTEKDASHQGTQQLSSTRTYTQTSTHTQTRSDITRHVTSGDVTRQTGVDVTRQTSGDVTRHVASSHASFLDSNSKVTGVQDILTRMRNADIVVQPGEAESEREARALLNKFLGATVLMAGMQAYVEPPAAAPLAHQVTVTSKSTGKVTSTETQHIDLDQCWDERILNTLLEQCDDYDQRRRIRARIRALMAEQEACTSAVTEALGDEHMEAESRETEETRTVTASIKRNSVERSNSATTETSRVIESVTRPAPKVSPFAKFRQLEKQNSLNSPSAEKAAPLFRFTEPALALSALTIKERLLQWCRDKTRDYENVKLENFSSSWADGLAFCALLHHFLPDAFDYSALTPAARRHNFHLAFTTAHEKADIYPLLDVEDMVAMRRPDWKCVFTYVQAIHRRFKDEP